jgi:large subunit ribosomal protein L25
MKESKLVAQLREGSGSAVARRLRRAGFLPGVVNSEGKESRKVQLNAHEFEMMLRHHTGENLLLDLEIAGEAPRKVLMREVQHDPVDGEAIHVDFVAVSMTKKMRVRIPLFLVGEAFGVVNEGGILEQLLRDIEIDCLPGDMVETIEVNVADLKLGHHLLVRDLKLDPKLVVVTNGTVAVAGVMAPPVEVEAVPAEGAAVPAEGAAKEPVVITEKQAEERQKTKEGGAKAGAKDGESKEKKEKK